ncbi:PDDEXK nuclease domain-containing protein, partial [Microvirga zambiensis]|uniref:PDDEXK nuclease domain-containing protein n=1 Tax=Microvirga zambiensis TaxID=1402137 RepID=UPI001FE283D5
APEDVGGRSGEFYFGASEDDSIGIDTPQSELAKELIKDPYSFDFLALGSDMSERELERSLLDHLRSLILELGKGFAFVGIQYPLQVAGPQSVRHRAMGRL